MEYNLDNFFYWFTGTDRETRGYFARRFFDNLPDDELSTINNLVNSAKHHRKRQRVADLATGAPDPKAAALGQGSKPTKVPCLSLPQPWWKMFDVGRIVRIDVEKVEVPNVKGKPKYFQLAGEVALVDFNGVVLYKKKILRAPGTFQINHSANNGFTFPCWQWGQI